LDPRIEAGTKLRLRSAVQSDQYRVRARARGLVNIQRHLARFAVDAVEGRKFHELWGDKSGEIDRTRFAEGPGLQAVRGHIQHERVPGMIRGGISKDEACALRIEAQGIDDAGSRELGRREILVGAQIQQIEFVDAGFVADIGQVVSVPRHGQFLDVPGNVAGNDRSFIGE
jgi:hypothetical protein